MKIKRLDVTAIIPELATDGAAGYDLTATSIKITDQYTEYGTSLAVAVPKGHVGLLFARSSVTKKDLMLKNAVGVIDSDYRGEVMVRFMEVGDANSRYIPGDRVAQLVVVPLYTGELEEVLTLDDTVRAEGAFGSTGL